MTGKTKYLMSKKGEGSALNRYPGSSLGLVWQPFKGRHFYDAH